MTIREIARIQVFPDSFKFIYNNIDYAYKMIGNAVPTMEKLSTAQSEQTLIDIRIEGIIPNAKSPNPSADSTMSKPVKSSMPHPPGQGKWRKPYTYIIYEYIIVRLMSV